MEEPEDGVTGDGVRKLSPSSESEDGVTKRATGDGVRKLSPSPTKPLVSRSRSRPSVPSWLILDRIVHRSTRRRCGVVPNDATGSALAYDLFDRPVRASLRIADPPAVSRLYLHLPGRPPIKRLVEEPKAIAAHRNSILFRLTVPFEDSSWWHDTVSFPDDYFVYSCRSSSPPSLTRLPTCFHGGTICPEVDKLYEPHRRQRQRTMLEQEIGILSYGNGEFIVAQLNFSGPDEFELCVLHRPPRAPSTSMEWSCKKVQKPPNMKTSAYSWRTDSVVPMVGLDKCFSWFDNYQGRKCLCWIDNYQGLLIIDVLADSNQQWVHYVPLPREAMTRRPYRDGGSLDPFRCVSATEDGIVKLVCVLTKHHPHSPHEFVITTWTLDPRYKCGWRDADVIMGSEEFFRVLGTAGHSCLPRVQPRFPLLSLFNPNVIYFLLDERDCGRFWIIGVNSRNKKLQSSTLYISEEEEEGYPPKRGLRNKFSGHQFIPSSFSSYLDRDAITSRKLSGAMQKAKEERVLQKSGLETQLKSAAEEGTGKTTEEVI